jgi:hypothetical protein
MSKNHNVSISYRFLIPFMVLGIGRDSFMLLRNKDIPTAVKAEIRLEMAQVMTSIAAIGHQRI